MAVQWMVAAALLLIAGSAAESSDDGSAPILEVVENSGVNQFVGQLFPEPVSGKLFKYVILALA